MQKNWFLLHLKLIIFALTLIAMFAAFSQGAQTLVGPVLYITDITDSYEKKSLSDAKNWFLLYGVC